MFRKKQITMVAILGLALVLATATVFATTQPAAAISNPPTGGGAPGTGGPGSGGPGSGQTSQGNDNSQGDEPGTGPTGSVPPGGAFGGGFGYGCAGCH